MTWLLENAKTSLKPPSASATSFISLTSTSTALCRDIPLLAASRRTVSNSPIFAPKMPLCRTDW